MILKLLAMLQFATGLGTHNEHDLMQHEASESASQIVVNINPEARVTAVRGASIADRHPCGTPIKLRVRIVNQGFVTAPMRASIIGANPDNLTIAMDERKLSGLPEEFRTISVSLNGVQAADVAIAFRISTDPVDFSETNQVALFLACTPQAASSTGNL